MRNDGRADGEDDGSGRRFCSRMIGRMANVRAGGGCEVRCLDARDGGRDGKDDSGMLAKTRWMIGAMRWMMAKTRG